ncbi:MAG TPA: chemotaxis protein CheA [Bryobacteraceae bacterium]|nr:chemotaxis protein CheA [Bryobacteraceae bacterium]
MALQVVMAEPETGTPPTWLPALENLRVEAAGQGMTEAAAAAADMLEAARRQAGSAEVQEGLARLQAAAEAQPVAGPIASPLGQDPELLRDFVLESREHLANIESHALTLERDPRGAEALNAVFRGFHTIKGLAGFLELWDIQHVAHEVETLLDRARNHQIAVTAAAIDAILESADDLRDRVAYVEAGLNAEGQEDGERREDRPAAPGPNQALIEKIASLSAAGASGEAGPSEDAQRLAAEDARRLAVEDAQRLAAEDAQRLAVEDARRLAEAVDSAGTRPEGAGPAKPEISKSGESKAETGRVEPAKAEAAKDPAPAEADGRRSEAMAVKVDTAKLDALVDMAGEMVIAQSLVRHDPDLAAVKTPRLQRNMTQLSRMTAELQRTAMAMRLVPIGPLFRRMERLVRDLARQFGKRVEMETQGDEIELDRNIVQELTDPLMHMVRNALDHGIESPAERVRAGKPPAARLLLKGRHQAGQVVIEIADDGRGLDREKIVDKAIQKGLIASGDALSDNEAFNLIFQAGFSTAAQVTNVSGRGVGMDVVRRHIEKLRGRVEIRSVKGQGATFALKLPLTLAIIDGLVVGVGEERYIAPLFAVREVLRPNAGTMWTVQQRSEMALIRGELLPVLRLYRKFRVQPRSEDPLASVLLVAEVEERRFGLLVDELIGKQEVVIKSLGETFRHVTGVSGGAILGDGRVGLILDLERLFREGADGAGS